MTRPSLLPSSTNHSSTSSRLHEPLPATTSGSTIPLSDPDPFTINQLPFLSPVIEFLQHCSPMADITDLIPSSNHLGHPFCRRSNALFSTYSVIPVLVFLDCSNIFLPPTSFATYITHLLFFFLVSLRDRSTRPLLLSNRPFGGFLRTQGREQRVQFSKRELLVRMAQLSGSPCPDHVMSNKALPPP